MLILTMLLIVLAWTILSSSNSMNLSLSIVCMSAMVSIIMGMSLSSWYALILFLIYIGGMMVMFSYFVSLSSNDPMMLKESTHFIILPLVLIKMTKLQMIFPMFFNSQVNFMYKSKNLTILLFVSILLLNVMIIVIKMMKKDNGPLRGFN